MRRRTWAAIACGSLAGILSAGCSPAAGTSEATVFAVVTGFSQGGPSTTIDIVNIGVPGSHNLTAHSVRVERISLVSVSPSVHLRSATAYAPGPGIGIVDGNLLRDCRQSLKPYPLTADVTPAHADTQWNIVLAITFAKPGRYNLHRVKIYYATAGHRGWQYQNLNTWLVISAPRKGEKPRFDGCPP
jgi:hypothetical protein